MASNLDILSDVLNSLRICGSLLLHESYAPPWAISIPDTETLGDLLGVQAGTKVVAFHLVERGYIEILPQDGGLRPSSDPYPLVVAAGEIVICFGGNAHLIAQGANPPCVAVETLLKGGDNPFRSEGEPRKATLLCLCGVFFLHDTHLNPLFAALPPMLHTTVAPSNSFHRLSGVADLIVQELHTGAPGSHYMVERLLEVLCAEAVRVYLNQPQPIATGWFTGLRDPVVSQALSLIHAQPGHNWSVNTLAQGVALSPSRFAARFKATLGESPMSYVSKWRIQVASRLLDHTDKTISEIATEVGYENLAAFNRAFKRHLDLPPGAWRSRHNSSHSRIIMPLTEKR